MRISIAGHITDASQNGVRIGQAWTLQNHNVQMLDFNTPNLIDKILKHNPKFCLVTMGRSFDHSLFQKLRDNGIFLVQWIPDEYGPSDSPGGLWLDKLKGVYNLLMCETKGIIPTLKDYADEVIWIPMYFDQRYHLAGVPKRENIIAQNTFKRDLVFMGGENEQQGTIRKRFLEKLEKNYNLTWIGRKGGEGHYIVGAQMSNEYVRSKIGLNFINDKLNQYELGMSNRAFKTIGSGCFLITQKVKGIEELLIPGKHCITYDPHDFDDLKSKIDYYLKHEVEREQIAKEGQQHVLKNYNIDKITKGFIEEICKRF